jgi:predicted nucleic acid-binding protein
MGKLIDTSILIEAERGRLDLIKHTKDSGDQDFFISVITVSELLQGVHRAVNPRIRLMREASVESMLREFAILDIDQTTARMHSRIWAELEQTGAVIGQNDFWLAATCLAGGLGMVTANRRHFTRVPGLHVEVWE